MRVQVVSVCVSYSNCLIFTDVQGWEMLVELDRHLQERNSNRINQPAVSGYANCA